MTQLSLASNQAEERKLSRDAKMRSPTPESEITRSKTPAVSGVQRRVSIVVVYRNADGARDYRDATERQPQYDERRWRSKAQRYRSAPRAGADARTAEGEWARSTPHRIRSPAGTPRGQAMVRTIRQGATLETLLTIVETVS
jgi:hypothetical protein